MFNKVIEVRKYFRHADGSSNTQVLDADSVLESIAIAVANGAEVTATVHHGDSETGYTVGVRELESETMYDFTVRGEGQR